MKRLRSLFSVTMAGTLLLTLSPLSRAADITIEQSALLYDLLAAASTAPPNVDPTIFNSAMALLKEEKLAGQSGRPNFQETGTLARYGKALYLGARAPEFATDIGKIRDLVSRGDRLSLEKALTDLWQKAGRAAPDKKALDPVIASLYGAKGEEPEETVNYIIDKPDRHIEVIHARAGGKMEVAVTRKNADGTSQDRTVFQGVTETVPAGNPPELQRHIKLEQVCTNTAATDADTMKNLNGEWKSQNRWVISGDSNSIKLEESRGSSPSLIYTGTYHLGEIAAKHRISAVTDMGESLPMSVRQQIIGKGVDFRISLETCGSDTKKLSGTWSSQHVTYDGMTLQISKIHDPYDLSLTLSRGASEKTAEGATDNEKL